MANPISEELQTGTVGELLVQLRLLQHGVQAAPPLRDSGNDLIALNGFSFRCVQVKTTTSALPTWPSVDKRYHLLAIVRLVRTEDSLLLDDSQIYLLKKEELNGVKRSWEGLTPFLLTSGRVAELFAA